MTAHDPERRPTADELLERCELEALSEPSGVVGELTERLGAANAEIVRLRAENAALRHRLGEGAVVVGAPPDQTPSAEVAAPAAADASQGVDAGA